MKEFFPYQTEDGCRGVIRTSGVSHVGDLRSAGLYHAGSRLRIFMRDGTTIDYFTCDGG